jgi:hypothetical protein
MSYDGVSETLPIKNIISGIVFWLSLIVGVVTQVILSRTVKKTLGRGYLKSKKKIGLISFFSNKYAAIFDIVMVAGCIGMIFSSIFSSYFGYLSYIIWFVFIFSFIMHCILNGKIYYYITKHNFNTQVKLQRSVENEKSV